MSRSCDPIGHLRRRCSSIVTLLLHSRNTCTRARDQPARSRVRSIPGSARGECRSCVHSSTCWHAPPGTCAGVPPPTPHGGCVRTRRDASARSRPASARLKVVACVVPACARGARARRSTAGVASWSAPQPSGAPVVCGACGAASLWRFLHSSASHSPPRRAYAAANWRRRGAYGARSSASDCACCRHTAPTCTDARPSARHRSALRRTAATPRVEGTAPIPIQRLGRAALMRRGRPIRSGGPGTHCLCVAHLRGRLRGRKGL